MALQEAAALAGRRDASNGLQATCRRAACSSRSGCQLQNLPLPHAVLEGPYGCLQSCLQNMQSILLSC